MVSAAPEAVTEPEFDPEPHPELPVRASELWVEFGIGGAEFETLPPIICDDGGAGVDPPISAVRT